MKRRTAILGAGATLLPGAWPILAAAQKPPPTIGFVNATSRQTYGRNLDAFLRGLEAAGFVEGRNVAIEYRWADGRYDRLPGLIDELVLRKVDVLAATTTPAAVVARRATTTLPIVFAIGGDPVLLGLVGNLGRPGGNVTGATTLNLEIVAKRLELARQLVPADATVAILVNPAGPNAPELLRSLRDASRALGLRLAVFEASGEREIVTAFEAIAAAKHQALVIGSDALFTAHGAMLGALSLSHRIPAVYQHPEFVEAGGLIGLGGDIRQTYLLAGGYAGRILKGEKPGDLPVQQVDKIELLLNLKTARAFGLTVPPSIVARATDIVD
jgi:putative ABC transport system substrate-binding protein